MRTRILPLLITMLFALSLASNAAANENSKMTPGTIAVVNNPDSNDRLNLRTNPSPDAPTLGKYYNGTYLDVCSGNADANKVAKNAEKVAQSQFVHKACILSLRMSETASKQTNPTKSAMSRLTESPAEGRSHRGPWEFPEEGGQHSRSFSLLFRLKAEEMQCFFNTNQ